MTNSNQPVKTGINNKIMTTSEKLAIAQDYYEKSRSRNLDSGWEKTVVTDGISTFFLRSGTFVDLKDMVTFKFRTTNGFTNCEIIS